MPNNLLKAIVVDDEKPSHEALSTTNRHFFTFNPYAQLSAGSAPI